eukprot:SAG11_NODE_29363_length_311_cov_1.462264_2_plen_25_part_01
MGSAWGQNGIGRARHADKAEGGRRD